MREERKKILYIVEAMGGGVFTYVVDMANDLSKDYDMYVAYQVRKQTPENFKEYFDKNVHLIEVKNFGRQIDPLMDIKAFFEIKRIARDINPDIIHLHSSKAGAIGRFAFNGKKIPLFYTPHGYSFLMQNQSPLKRAMYKVIESVCAKRNCTTISCSEGEHKETLKLTSRATYVDNGINMKDLKNLMDTVSVEKKDERFTVFTLGRICYQKNPRMFNQVALAMPDIRFVWIGDGELRDELTAPNIEITGWVERKDALKQSINGDAFILTSLWEGLPISLLEAMFMKKICAVSNVIGNRDVIHENVNGFVCDEAEDFVQAIRKMIGDKTFVRKLVSVAFNQVNEQYNTNAMSRKYSAIYNEAMNYVPDAKVVYINDRIAEVTSHASVNSNITANKVAE